MKKILSIMMLMLMMFVTSTFAAENETVVLNESLDAGYTPDDTVMYNFDRFGDWVSLNFAKLQGEEKYEAKEAEILQERLQELKLVKEETRIEFQKEIELKIQERKERKEQKLEELKIKIEERKQEKIGLNETSVVDDETIDELEKEIEKIEIEIESDDNGLRKKVKKVVEYRNGEVEKLKLEYEQKEFEARVLDKELEKFREENKELFEKYGSIIEEFNGETFRIRTDQREIIGEVKDGDVEFKSRADDVDYEIEVKSEAELRKMIETGEGSYEDFEDNVDAPLKLKTKIAYNVATFDEESSDSEE